MKRWYIAQTYSGYENSVKLDIERKTEVQKIFPGYIFLEIEVDPKEGVRDDVWFMIRNTQKVTGFLGSSGGGTKPTPVNTEEMNQILRKLGLAAKPVFDMAVGDKVSVSGKSGYARSP